MWLDPCEALLRHAYLVIHLHDVLPGDFVEVLLAGRRADASQLNCRRADHELVLALLEVKGRAVLGAREEMDAPCSICVEGKDVQHRLFTRRPVFLERLIEHSKGSQEAVCIVRLERDEAPQTLLDTIGAEKVGFK